MPLGPTVPADSTSEVKEQSVPVAPEERVGEEADVDMVDLLVSNIAQTIAPRKEVIIRELDKYRSVFPANPTIVHNSAKFQLPLTDSSRTPQATNQRRHSPE